VHDAEEYWKNFSIEAYWWGWIRAISDHGKMDASRTTEKEIGKYHNENIADYKAKKDVVRKHPSSRR